jgi:DNA-binding MarR family transcriptional regulator
MVAQRLSRLQKRILKLLLVEHQRTQGSTSLGHLELVKALGKDKSNISHSLRTLETRRWIDIGRTQGGQANYLYLTAEGLKKTFEISNKL